MNFYVNKPSEFSLSELMEIYALIGTGGQIKLAPAVLLKQICSCKLVGVVEAHEEQNFIACAAIKVPQKSYLDKVFSHAGIKNLGIEYELGYCVTHPDYNGQGLCKGIIQDLLRLSPYSLFATTQSAAMAHILTKNGFVKTGNTHVTDDNHKIDLYIYEI